MFASGLGQVFVVRVAGNVAAPEGIASLEFAVAALKVPLIVIMGHEGCGAVAGTLASVRECRATGKAPSAPSENLLRLQDHIRPSVEWALDSFADQDEAKILREATERNVSHSVQTLLRESDIIRNAVEEGTLNIVCSEYFLADGAVQELDVPESR